MTTADEFREEALSLAKGGVDREEAVGSLLARADRRVAVVLAKRHLETQVEDGSSDPSVTAALELLDEVLQRGEWAE